MSKILNIGIIGMSPGNAHPYSWSAIINGHYNSDEITAVGYPGVSAYLNANKDTIGINGANVNFVWSQERSISESIAKTTNIKNIADRPEEMIGHVDAVILARDDAENHFVMAKPFIDAGIPIFIDKPLAYSEKDLQWFASENSKGKFIMSCSSMRYSNECRTAMTEMGKLGKLELITAVGKKDWAKYGVHMLEAVFTLINDPVPVSVKHVGSEDKDSVIVGFQNGLKAFIHLYMDIAPTFQVSLFGNQGWNIVEIKNSYSMFRDNIIEFLRSVQDGKPRLEFQKTENIIKVLIGAKKSLDEKGVTIFLK